MLILFQGRHRQLSSQFLSLKPGKSTHDTILLTVEKLDFKKGKIKIADIDLQMEKCNLKNSDFSYTSSGKYGTNSLQIYNSSFTQAKFRMEQGNVHIFDSSFRMTDGKNLKTTLIALRNSNMIIEDCIFQNLSIPKGVAAIQTKNSTTNLLRSFFIGNEGSAGVINITDFSNIEIKECVIEGNTGESVGGALAVSGESRVSIYFGNFYANVADAGPCVYSTEKSIVTIMMSKFDGNEGGHGGVLFGENSANFTIYQSTFLANKVRKKKTHGSTMINAMGGAIYIKKKSYLTLIDCNFSANVAELATQGTGGAVWVENSVLVTERCNFLGNQAFEGGCINIGSGSQAYIVDSLFEKKSSNVCCGYVDE